MFYCSGSNPFNKQELACILKFGAEELFNKENEDEEGELQVCVFLSIFIRWS